LGVDAYHGKNYVDCGNGGARPQHPQDDMFLINTCLSVGGRDVTADGRFSETY
jgi:hypothetical protein